MNYYNDNDPFCCAWLRRLRGAKHLPMGLVDEQSIVTVQPARLANYRQCHFFAGIGGWPLALQLAGWPDEWHTFTGSAPCQPFSAAGKRKALHDERDLWPAFFKLIAECRPQWIFGEQVEAAIGWGWLDRICDDLDGEGYAVRAAVLPACSVGAPHIRQRLYWCAQRLGDTGSERRQQIARGALTNEATNGREPDGNYIIAGAGEAGGMAYDNSTGREQTSWPVWFSRQEPDVGRDGKTNRMAQSQYAQRGAFNFNGQDGRNGQNGGRPQAHGESGACGEVHGLGEPKLARRSQAGSGPQIHAGSEPEPGRPPGWAASQVIECLDGKLRRIPLEPRFQPLADGLPGRVGRLRAYGNAIVPQVAAEFVKAVIEDAREHAPAVPA